MSNELIFLMGQFEAGIPTDRRYARNHMWALGDAEQLRFGFSSYAVRLLQDVYFLDWSIDAGSQVKTKDLMGLIESKKAESDLFAPVAGTLREFNQELLADPSAINVDKYGVGWLFEMATADVSSLLTPEQYLEHLGSVWEVTQRTIKGQMNE